MKFYWLVPRRPHHLLYVLLTLLTIGSVILLCHLLGIQLCPLNRFTGFPCMTCGSTRAVMALLKLDFRTAFLLQPLVTVALLVALPLAALFSYTAFVQKRLPMVELSKREKLVLITMAGIAALLNWSYLVYIHLQST